MMTESEEPTGNITLPGPKVTIPDPGEVIVVHRNDWIRIRRCVKAVAKPAHYAENLAWAMLGVSISAILAWLPWQAVYGQLNKSAHYRYAFVNPLLIVVAIAAFIIAALSLVFAYSQRGQRSTDVTDIVTDMDSIHPL